MKKILWIGVLMSALLASAFMSVSNSRVGGPAQLEPPRPATVRPVVAPRSGVAGEHVQPAENYG
jgi:hypothetical protein